MAVIPDPATTNWVPIWNPVSTGPIGPIGPQGPPGPSSSVLKYRADITSTSMSTDPGNGKMRWNNATQNLSTVLSFDRVTDEGFDVTGVLIASTIDDEFIIQDQDLAASNQIWKKTGPGVVIGADWFNVPVVFVSGATVFTNNQRLAVIIKTAGTPGPTGPQGPTGPTGPTGPAGAPGATGGIHHTQHEPGGTDVIQNVGWTNLPNIFTANQRVTKIRPYWELQNTGGNAVARFGQHSVASRIDIMSNHSFNGTDVISDDTSLPSAQYSQLNGSHQFFTVPAGANPRTSALLEVFRIDATGLVTVPTGNLLVTKIRPELQTQYTAAIAKTRVMSHVVTNGALSYNASYDGTNYNRDDTSIGGMYLTFGSGGGFNVNNFLAGTNPIVATPGLIINGVGVITAPSGNIRITAPRPMLEVQYPGNPVISRVGQVVAGNRIDISSNLSYDGSNWNADDISQVSSLYIQQTDLHVFFTVPTGPNPRTPIQQMQIGSGGVNINLNGGNVALKNFDNVFSVSQTIKLTNPIFTLVDTARPADSQIWRIWNSSNLLLFDAINDNNTVIQSRAYFDRAGNFITSGSHTELGRVNPMGYWVAYTPTIVSEIGTVSFVTIHNSRYTAIGKTLIISILADMSSTGSPRTITVGYPAGFVNISVYQSGVGLINNTPVSTQGQPGTASFVVPATSDVTGIFPASFRLVVNCSFAIQ